MPYVTWSDALRAARRAHPGIDLRDQAAAARRLRRESIHKKQVFFDIFLCHSIHDAVLIAGLKRLLEETGASVYVDWIDDPQLDRERVTVATAGKLRQRILQSRCLIYADTPSAKQSIWMPWELGYADGELGRVAVLPVVHISDDEYDGREFVGLYPKVSLIDGSPRLRTANGSQSIREWRTKQR